MMRPTTYKWIVDSVGEKSKRRITRQSAKSKGRKFQQQIAARISELLDIPWGKDELIDSRPASQTGVDVILIGDAKKRFNYAVECKAHEKWAVHDWIDQSRTNIVGFGGWLLFITKSRFGSVVLLPEEEFHIITDLLHHFSKTYPPFNTSVFCQKSWSLPDWIGRARLGVRGTPTNWLLLLQREESTEKFVVLEAEVLFDLLRGLR